MNKSTKHQFALYCTQLPKDYAGTIIVTDPLIVQRLFKVLRLSAGDAVTLFDGKRVFHVTIDALDKKQLTATVNDSTMSKPITPTLNCFVPVLKRDALEEVIYAAVEMGASRIQLVFTQKIHRAWAGRKEFERLHGIMIAACEQAKQFCVPELCEPIEFTQMLSRLSGTSIFFDAQGQPAFDVVKHLREQKSPEVSLLMGPEADLDEQEKQALRNKNVLFCALTPTVLRARQAFAVGLGIFRSMLL